MTTTSVKKIASAGAAFAVAAGTMLAAAPLASASGTGTACPANRVCFYFTSDLGGARADYQYSDATMGNELFSDGPAGRNGYNVQVDDNAASVKNNSGATVLLFEAANCSTGSKIGAIAAGGQGNLNKAQLKNQVSSFIVSDGSACINRDQTGA